MVGKANSSVHPQHPRSAVGTHGTLLQKKLFPNPNPPLFSGSQYEEGTIVPLQVVHSIGQGTEDAPDNNALFATEMHPRILLI